jgi:itaconyl-CoA hydratase
MTEKAGWNGRFFEDFEIGDVYRHPLGRTITTTDNIWFTLLTQNTAALHFDHNYASQTEFKRPLVNSCLTLSIVTGQSVTDISQNALANLEWDGIKLLKPVFEGDTLYSRSTVLDKRTSNSRESVGIVTVQTSGFNQEGVEVISFKRTVMVFRRGFGPTAPHLIPA